MIFRKEKHSTVLKISTFALLLLTLCAVLFLACKELPSDPYIPQNAESTLLLKSSKLKIEPSYIEESVNQIFNIGVALTYPEFIDSVIVVVKNSDTTIVKADTLRTLSTLNKRDTVWIPFFYLNPTKLSIFSTAYIKTGIVRTDDATVLISGTAATNHAPAITVSGQTIITSKDTCKLTVTATDQDANFTTGVSMIKAPAGAVFTANNFRWKSSETYVGTDTVLFVATDNGTPPLSDTETVIISVRAGSAVTTSKLQVVTYDSTTMTITWGTVDSADFYYVYGSDSLTGTYAILDTVKTTTFKDTISSSTQYYTVTAIDGQTVIWSSDTLASSMQLATDNKGPEFIFRETIKDSMTITSPNFTTDFICRDSSGVASVVCSLGTQICSTTKLNDTTYTVAVNGLPSDVYSTLIFNAVDNSFRKNIGRLLLTLKSISTITDTINPAISLVSPSDDSVIINNNSVNVQLLCTDNTSIGSVVCSLSTTAFIATSTSGNIYTATVTGLVSGVYNTIIATTQDIYGNKARISFSVKYDPTAADNSAPTLTCIAPVSGSSVAADSVTLQFSASDASGVKSVTCSFGTNNFTVTQSATTANLYSVTVRGLIAGQFNQIKLFAADSSLNANKDSLLVAIKYDNDVKQPVVKFVSPPQDSTSTNSGSATVKVSCTDESGIASVACSMNNTSFTASHTPGDSIWSVNIAGLVQDQFNLISIIATDSSLAANKDTLNFCIKYDPTIADTAGPTVWQISGPLTGTIVTSPIVTIVDSIADPNNIDSVYWTLNNGTKNIVTQVTGMVNHYSLTCTLPKENLDTIVVTAVDKSTRRNKTPQIIILNYLKPPAITAQPLSQTICGTQAVFTVTATGSAPLAYQWRKGSTTFTNITKATSPVCTLSNVTSADNGTILSCVVSNGSGTDAISSSCTLTVNALSTTPTAVATPSTIVSGSSSVLSVSAGTLGTGASWKWYASKTGTALTSDTVNPTTTAWYFVRGEGTCGNSAWDSVLVTVNTNSTTPTAAATPTTVCPGETSVLSVSAGTLGTGATWKWYASKTGTALTSDTVKPTATTWYFVRGEGTSGNSAWDSVVVTVKSIPSITTQPASILVCPSTQVVFTVAATGTTPLTYQWYKGAAMISTATNPACTLTAATVTAAINNAIYTCKVTNECGTIVSNPCTLTVNTVNVAPTSITASPDSICPGGSTTLTVVGGSLGIGAEWKWSSSMCGYGALGSGSEIVVSPTTSTTYFVRAEGGCGTTTCASVHVTVNSSPVIDSQPPAAKSVCYYISTGSRGNITCKASGGTGTLTYQWYSSGTTPATKLVDDSYLGGTTTYSLTIKGGTNTILTGPFYCVVTDSLGCSVTSTSTSITVDNSTTCSVTTN